MKNSGAEELLTEVVGADPHTDEGIAELLRYEVSARGSSPRHTVLRRVERLAAPAAKIDLERLAEVCDVLVREGDLVTAPGGLLVASPVRFVERGPDVFRVFASMPSRWLKERVPSRWVQEGVRRTCLADVNRAALESAVSALEGIFLSASAWAGLDRAPLADSQWIESLDRRLEWNPSGPGSLERDGPIDWKRLSVGDGQISWSYPDKNNGERLWRARHAWQGWVSCWTSGPPPSESSFVRLSPAEAARACFALARVAKHPLRMNLRRDGETSHLSIDHWLPIAEYRYLSLHATRATADKGLQTWTLPADQAGEVCRLLQERLGIEISEVNAS